ncbi:PaeR7I family type II restriction endonuclease [Micromonospora sp. WMMD1155]|uniref:PaeR7I family type II restriction endonuclease n=1 Tax=Micromonospora sp. WMMD1155 TaxID=3016094 RepID=UPI00249A4916|nr:PaeR7I family type II restriction endonuclease [Micromonospora sp. WMMD1155]WFE51468.1 PaeR7I family type II restriction endonuclease [Micromonospora sp. WMMD1155]
MTPEQDRDVNAAMFAYWTSRERAALRQAERGEVQDAGGRANVTSGGHLDEVARLLAKVCLDAGAPLNEVWYKAPEGDPNRRSGVGRNTTLPGYYRPTKQWDLVVHHHDVPIIVVELKSQNGPSYGNNANNRVEEAIGSAVDFSRARKAGLIQGSPWIGYAFIIEDDIFSRKNESGKDSSRYAKDRYFADWSYVHRVRLLSQRLVEDGHYDSAWAVATSRPDCPGVIKPKNCPQLKTKTPEHVHEFAWWELDPESLGYGSFAAALTAQVKRYYPSGSTPALPMP